MTPKQRKAAALLIAAIKLRAQAQNRTQDMLDLDTLAEVFDLVAGQHELAVWYGSMPETNGKMNWTAVLYRKAEGVFDGPHMTIARSEYPDRVRYEADRVRYMLGDLEKEPFILDYDSELRTVLPEDDVTEGDAALEKAAQGFEKFFQAKDTLDVEYVCGCIRAYKTKEGRAADAKNAAQPEQAE